jgi:hypothetical protein
MLSASAPDSKVETSLVTQQVSLTPGEVKAVAVGLISHHHRPLLGRSTSYPFAVLATSSNNESASLPGEVIVTPRLPWWVLVLVFLALTLCGVLTAAYAAPIRNWIQQLFNPPPKGSTSIYLTPDKDLQIEPGACVVFEWEVSGAKQVYFQGQPAPFKNRTDECPKETTTYYLTVLEANGAKTTRQVTVNVGASMVTTEPPKAVERFLVRPVNGGLAPDLAVKWDVSPDNKTWTFYLDKVLLQNGNMVNSGVIIEALKKNSAEAGVFPTFTLIDDLSLTVSFGDIGDEVIQRIITNVVFWVQP